MHACACVCTHSRDGRYQFESSKKITIIIKIILWLVLSSRDWSGKLWLLKNVPKNLVEPHIYWYASTWIPISTFNSAAYHQIQKGVIVTNTELEKSTKTNFCRWKLHLHNCMKFVFVLQAGIEWHNSSNSLSV